MNVRKLMLMVGALALAIICAVLARSMFSGSAAPQAAAAQPAEPVGPEVLVATRTLPPGTILGPDTFRYQRWPSDLVEKAYYIKGEQSAASLAGTVVRYPITAGQPLTQGAVIKPGDRGFLAAALGPGMRAVTISVSQQSGVAGFVFPGDRVDLLLTQTVSGDGPPLKATETIVRNIRVLATDQRTDKTSDADGKTVVQNVSNVTLETTPKLSEKIAVAQQIGAISLSLRSIADDRLALEQAIASGEVNVPDSNDPRATKQMMLEVSSRPNDHDTSVTTGGEVSRFQRSSMPPRPASEGAAPAGQPAPVGAAMPRGPIIIIARGSTVTQVPVGGGH
jgi:pilus assembly protein CpaB